MNARKLATMSIVLGLLASAGGCEKQKRDHDIKKCSIHINGKKVFYGSTDCISDLPTESMHGYWLVDFETSLFFLSLEDLQQRSIKNAYSLSFVNAPSNVVRELSSSPRERVFLVSFDGSKSEVLGVYGSLPELRGGVVVKREFVVLSELQNPPMVE